MGPKNFYNAVDQRKLGTDKIDAIQNELDSIISLPPVTSEDEGKTMVVSDQGEWEVGSIDNLPPVTSEDNGKMMQVVNGKWAKAEPASVKPFVVTITADANGNVTANKTYAEITAALNGGQNVLMNWINHKSEEYSFSSNNNIPLSYSNAHNNYYTFTVSYIGDGEVSFTDFNLYSDNTVIVTQQTIS